MPVNLLRSRRAAGFVAVISFVFICLAVSVSVYMIAASRLGLEGNLSSGHSVMLLSAACAIAVEILLAWYLVVFGWHGNPFKLSQSIKVILASLGTLMYVVLRFMSISNEVGGHAVSMPRSVLLVDVLFLFSISAFLMACAWIALYARELKEDSDSIC